MIRFIFSIKINSTNIPEHGRVIPTLEQLPVFTEEPIDLGRHTIAYDARYLKELFQRVLDG